MKTTKKSLLWSAAGLGGLLAVRFLSQQQRTLDLANKVVLVTGGSRGLGLEIAREFIREGAKVAICARNTSDLKKAHRQLAVLARESDNKHNILAIPCDVSNVKQIQQMVRKIERKLGSVEILVNNAGTIQVGPVEEMQLQEYAESLNTHFWGPLYVMETILPGMKKRQEGRIINISSVGGKVSIPHLVPYSAGKHALTGLSEGYRAALIKDNIYVTTVCPGLMRTGSPKNAMYKGKHRKEYAWFAIADAFPPVSMDATTAAQEIVHAARQGKSTVVLTWAAKALTAMNGLLPGLLPDIAGLANRWLPDAGGIGKDKTKGYQSESWLAPSLITLANQLAARKNNE